MDPHKALLNHVEPIDLVGTQRAAMKDPIMGAPACRSHFRRHMNRFLTEMEHAGRYLPLGCIVRDGGTKDELYTNNIWSQSGSWPLITRLHTNYWSCVALLSARLVWTQLARVIFF